jgi:hypothetical protein
MPGGNSNSSYSRAFAVTLNDTNQQNAEAFIVTAAGTVNITTSQGDAVTVQAAAGTVIPISVNLFRTGGTATGIVGLNP